MVQKQTFGSNTSGCGTSTTPSFGSFKPTTGTNALGAPPAFGASAAPQPATERALSLSTEPFRKPLATNPDGAEAVRQERASVDKENVDSGAGTGILGAATTQFPTSSTTTPSFGGLGAKTQNQQSTGLFCAKPATTSFGCTPASNSLGGFGPSFFIAKPQQTTAPTFGSTAPSDKEQLSQTTERQASSLSTEPIRKPISTNPDGAEAERQERASVDKENVDSGANKELSQIQKSFAYLLSTEPFFKPLATNPYGAERSVRELAVCQERASVDKEIVDSGADKEQLSQTTERQASSLSTEPFRKPMATNPDGAEAVRQERASVDKENVDSGASTGILGTATTQTPTSSTTTPSFGGLGTKTQNHQSTGLSDALPATTDCGSTPASSNLGGFGTSKPQQTAVFTFGSTAQPDKELSQIQKRFAYLLPEPLRNLCATNPDGAEAVRQERASVDKESVDFGAFGQQQAPTGTGHIKYNPVVGTDVVFKSSTWQIVKIERHCITCMMEYEDKSLEELRLEDYTAGRKGATTGGMFTGFQQPTENKPLFGDIGFAQPATTSTSLFGGGGLCTSGFGQTSFGFGNTSTPGTSGTGLFGSPSTSTGFLGQQNTNIGGGGLFTNTGSAFGPQPALTGTLHIEFVLVNDGVLANGGVVPVFGADDVNVKHQCITCMRLEEPGLEDYTAGRKGAPTGGMFTGFQQPTENKPLFGGTSCTQPATTSASLFGGGGLCTSGFGQTNASSFGGNTLNQTTSTGLFGNKPAFGAASTTGTGILGTATTQTPNSSTTTPSFGGLGTNTQNQQSTGLFGTKPATTGFGSTPGSSSLGGFGTGFFAAKPQQTTAPTFGSTAQSDKEQLSQTTERQASSLSTEPFRKPLATNPDGAERSVRELAVRQERASVDKENVDFVAAKEQLSEITKRLACLLTTKPLSKPLVINPVAAGSSVRELAVRQERASVDKENVISGSDVTESASASAAHNTSDDEVEIIEEPPEVIVISSDDENPSIEDVKK